MADKSENPSATAVPVSTVPSGAANSSVPMHLQPKQGAKCCGSCCDYRRAVIVLAIIFLVLSVLGLIGALSTSAALNNIDGVDDDEALDAFTDINRFNAIISAIAIVSSICALCGAKNYNVILVGIDVAWTLISWIIGVIIQISARKELNTFIDDDAAQIAEVSGGQIAIGFIFTCLFMYPGIGFIYEVNKGIMSEETYPREEYSCCCTDKKN